ncbi:uncharacterized protein LOC124279784 [Haliotis rubra]|uniref:uncharacterized protein LOC124279784 n=1 Tax=Haliotis rubra TaxID=36100 RepID=UPI001EE579F1|nr:uncharacterized protein LOC124279784 [Haliotis rubra]
MSSHDSEWSTAGVRHGFEARRLKSFLGVDIAVSRIELAKAGFYATGDGDETRCFSCGVRYKNWRQGERPDNVIHKHNCRHSHGLHRGNVPFTEDPLPLSTDITSSRLWYPTSDYDLHDPQPEIHSPYLPPRPGSLISSVPGTDYHTPDYNQGSDRLASFRGWPRERGPTPRQLAAAGFYYTGFLDKVRCFCCGVRLREWDEEDDPWREHARYSPNCRFLTERCPTDTTPQVTGSGSSEIHPQRAAMKRKNESQDNRQWNRCILCLDHPANIVFLPCGHLVVCVMCKQVIQRCPVCSIRIRGCVRIYPMSHQSSRHPSSDQSSRHPSSDFTLRDPSPEIPPTSIIPPDHRPTSIMSSASKPETGTNYYAPDYHLETDRLSSFQGWPSERTPTPQQLAIAGFYYTGFLDKVRCFCCGVRLRKLDEEDDPWREHTRFSPNCRFLAERSPADTTPQETTMRIKSHTLMYIYIRCLYVIPPKSKYVFELKYGNIITKKVGGGHLPDIVVNITCFDKLSSYFTKSHKNMAFPMFYMPELRAFQHISIVVYTNPSISLNGNFEALVARRGATLQEIMVYEALRLKSFLGVDTATVSTIHLAAAGFYATERSGEIRCFSCGIRQRIGPQAPERHQTDCRHRNGLPCGNITFADCPLASEWNIIRNLPRYPTTDIDLHQPQMRPTARQLPGNVANNAYEPRQANHAVPDYPIEASPAALGVRLREGRQAPQKTPGEDPKREGSPGFVGPRELDEDQGRLFRDINRGYNFPVGDRSGTFTSLQVTQLGNTPEAFGNAFSGHGLEHPQFMESSLCRICRENPRSIHFHPCGHLVAGTFRTPSERCPVCRQHLA